LLEKKLATEAELNAIDAEVQAAVAAAGQAAEMAPWPDAATATNHVYCDPAPFSVAADVRKLMLSKSQSPLTSAATGLRKAQEPSGREREISFVAATVEALDHEMAHNPCIFVLGEGIGVRGGNFATTAGLFAKYGAERLCDTPICERGFVGLGCGAAMTGTRPVVDFMFIDFINDAFGELINQIAKMQYMSSGRLRMPILLRGCVGLGHSAATHHSGSYHSIFSHIPGLRVGQGTSTRGRDARAPIHPIVGRPSD
jgi:2-oxoisovalerate dehydrogenase E1 component